MPLAGNPDYNGALLSSISEQWLFELRNNTYTNGSVSTQYIRLSTAEVSGYDPLISNNPSIRENIDLVQSTSKNGNISINCVNATLSNHSATLAEEIYGGTRRYINHDVVILSRVGGYTLQIYSGRLKSVSLTNQDTVSIEIAARTPIDYLKIPRYTSQAGNFFPIIYGDGTAITSTVSSPALIQYSPAKCFPLLVDTLNNGRYNCLAHQAVTDGKLHYPVKDSFSSTGFPLFVPLDDVQNNSYDDYEGATNDTNRNVLFTALDLHRSYLFRPIQDIDVAYTIGLPVSSGNFYDNNASTYSTWAVTMDVLDAPFGEGLSDTETYTFSINDIVKEEHEIQECKLFVKWGITSYSETPGMTLLGRLKVAPTYGGSTNTVVITSESSNRTAAYESAIDLLSTGTFSSANGQIPDNLDIIFEAFGSVPADTSASPGSLTFEVYDFYLEITTKITDTENLSNSSAVTSIKKLYTGTNGLDKSWSAGNSVTNIVQMHRDLIYRFAGITTTPENFSALDSARSGWTIFYYLNEEIELEKLLEQCQREGGFIFRFKANDGSPQYIYLVDTPITNHTISKDDITNTKISLTPFDSLITKRIIKHQRNSINDELLFEVQCTDTTNDPRGDYNVQSEENTVTDELEILNGNIVNSLEGKTIASTNMGAGSKNDGFANYYNAIEGNPKLLVETDIINPGSSGGSSYFYLMEVGDICAFDHTNMTIEPFGQSFNGKKFIVTSLTRSPGSLKVSLREI